MKFIYEEAFVEAIISSEKLGSGNESSNLGYSTRCLIWLFPI